MNSFSEVCNALRLDACRVKTEYNRIEGTLRLYFEPDALTAREENGRVILEAVRGEETARREYGYDEAYKVLSALADGSARPEVTFPFSRKEKGKKTQIAGVVFGLLLALINGIGTLGYTAYAIDSGSEPFLSSLSIILFFAGVTALGIALAVFSAKGKMDTGKFFGVGGGLFMALIMLTLILGIWSTRPGDNETPLAAYISLSIVFGLCVAGGMALAIHSARSSGGPDHFVRYPLLRVLPSEENVRRLVEAVKERTAREAIRIKTDYARQPAIFQSKLGGLPYWDPSRPYPCDEEGSKLTMLAQFNLSELPENSTLPTEGMLQFFIRCDEEYGLSSKPAVVYHRSVDRSLREKDVLEMGVPCPNVNAVDFPVSGEIAVGFEPATVHMNPTDGGYDDMLSAVADELGIEEFDGFSAFVLHYGNEGDPFESAYGDGGSFLLGYPYFVQDDYRDDDTRKKYDLTLLRLDSETSREYPDKYIMWGDVGTGNFLISSVALRNMELDDVFYTWDCC